MRTLRTNRPNIRGPGGLLLVVLCAFVSCSERTVHVPAPPKSFTNSVIDTLHGEAIADKYRWLEDAQSRRTRDWIEAQNAYTDSVLQQFDEREDMHSLMKKLIMIDRSSRPVEAEGLYFYSLHRAGDELPVICVRQGLTGTERILVDPHKMSGDHSTSVQLMDVSHDGKLICYAVRSGGADEAHIRFLDVATGRDLPELLPTGRYMSVELSPDHGGVYYVRHGVLGPRLYYHRLRHGAVRDREIFGGALGPEKIMWADLSEDGRWLLVSVSDGSAGTVALHMADLSKGMEFKAIVDDGVTRNYGIFAGHDLVILTNSEATRWRVMRASCHRPEVEDWIEIIPEQPEAAIELIEAVGGHLFVGMIRDAHYTATIYDIGGSKVRDIELEELGSIEGPTGRWSSDEAFFSYTSFHVPRQIIRYEVSSGDQSVWFNTEVPVETDQISVSRVRYASLDGTRIPMFLVHRRDLERNGDAPVLLYGFGGFGAQITPWFSALGATIVNSGGVFAIPNLRGGGEFGEDWHRAGMRENKQNVFDDFIAAAKYLIREKYTQPKRIAIYGGSNGGLLVGACMTQRPELFGAVVATYPLMDMLRYHKFLVAQFWIPEFGSSDDPEQYAYLRKYSPYHNVTSRVVYPATMMITGDADTRVDPLHARKMTALLQAANSGHAPILLRYHTRAGHSGGQPLSKVIEELVDTFSFLSWQVGLRLNDSSLP